MCMQFKLSGRCILPNAWKIKNQPIGHNAHANGKGNITNGFYSQVKKFITHPNGIGHNPKSNCQVGEHFNVVVFGS